MLMKHISVLNVQNQSIVGQFRSTNTLLRVSSQRLTD